MNIRRIAQTHESLRTPVNFPHVYRSLQVLFNRFNDFLNITAMQGQKCLNLLLTTMAVYGTLRFYHSLNVLAYLAFPSVSFACIVFANVGYPYGGILASALIA